MITCTSTHCERRQECASPDECTGSAKYAVAAAHDLLAAVQFLLPRVPAHKPDCSLYETHTCDCGDWNKQWISACVALTKVTAA